MAYLSEKKSRQTPNGFKTNTTFVSESTCVCITLESSLLSAQSGKIPYCGLDSRLDFQSCCEPAFRGGWVGTRITCDQALCFGGARKYSNARLVGQSAVSQALVRREKSTPDTFTARVVCRQSRIWTFV